MIVRAIGSPSPSSSPSSRIRSIPYRITAPLCGRFVTDTRQQNNKDKGDKTSRSTPSVQGTIPYGGKGVRVGQYAQVQRSFTLKDVQTFGRVIGDENPLHQQWSVISENDDGHKETERIVQDNCDQENSLPNNIDVIKHPLTRFHHDSKQNIQSTSLSTASSQSTALSSSATTNTRTIPIVHGMLVGSLLSSIFGTLTPGAVYLNQTFQFQKPVYVDDSVVGRATIIRIRDWTRRRGRQDGGGNQRTGVVLTCRTEVMDADTNLQQQQLEEEDTDHGNKDKNHSKNYYVTGEANVWISTGHPAPKDKEVEG